jgi:hypothetical protein
MSSIPGKGVVRSLSREYVEAGMLPAEGSQLSLLSAMCNFRKRPRYRRNLPDGFEEICGRMYK